MSEHEEYGLGRVYRPDPRDRMYAMETREASSASKMWRVGETGDQGNTPQCVGYAWRHFLAASPIMERIGRELPTATRIYNIAQTLDPWAGENYAGTSVRAGAEALRQLGLIKGYIWATDMASLKSHIQYRGPVVIGVDWFHPMFRPRGEYIVPAGSAVGGHAVLLHGWSEERKAFRGLNSWGKDWGNKGKFWLDEQDARYLIFQANGEACSAIEVE